MIADENKIKTVDDYIVTFPKEIQLLLKQMRKVIKESAPDAQEVISYQMPAYKYKGMVAYFAAHKNHIGFYPGISAVETFSMESKGYKTAKGTIQFPFDKPLPLELIAAIIKFKMQINTEKAQSKRKRS